MVEMGLYNVDLVFNNDLDGFDIDFGPEGDPYRGALFYTMLDKGWPSTSARIPT